jgi:hypothetical protein
MQTGYRFVQISTATLVLVAASFVLFLLLLPVPADFARGMPTNLSCDFFAANRRGWECARWGDITRQPAATLLATLAYCGAFLWLRALLLSSRSVFVAFALLALPLGLFAGLAAVLRIIYFVLGSASAEYLLWTLPIAAFSALICGFIWIAVRRPVKFAYGFSKQHMGREDTVFQNRIDLEISERKMEIMRGNNDGKK